MSYAVSAVNFAEIEDAGFINEDIADRLRVRVPFQRDLPQGVVHLVGILRIQGTICWVGSPLHYRQPYRLPELSGSSIQRFFTTACGSYRNFYIRGVSAVTVDNLRTINDVFFATWFFASGYEA